MKEEHMNSLDKMEEEKMREAFTKWQTTEEALQSVCQLTTAGFEYAIWKAAIAHANTHNSAILEDYDRLAKLCEKQAAIISMQAEKLRLIKDAARQWGGWSGTVEACQIALSASAESVAAWEAEHAAKVLEDVIDTCNDFAAREQNEPSEFVLGWEAALAEVRESVKHEITELRATNKEPK